MPLPDQDYDELTRTLIANFNVLADEVQFLSDRKTILEHKLNYAHSQLQTAATTDKHHYQILADKYAPSDPDIASTLAKLQLPPDLQATTPVPLPQRGQRTSKQQTAVAIRDGRRAAQRLSDIGSPSISGTSSRILSARRTSLSTVLEQDFTVPGKKSSLHCPFTKSPSTMNSNRPLTPSDAKDPTPHQSSDPICAALYTETTSSPPPSAAGSVPKCPIRFLDQHSPEEVAHYFETHKHEIPRSHEVCVKRYQRNEEDIRKLDAKYGNLVSMIQGLGAKHQPMLPSDQQEGQDIELEHTSQERVEHWANTVSADGVGVEEEEEEDEEDEDDRESRFDRPLKEVRVGESPSRPWGISVPYANQPTEERPESPPPAPVSAGHVPKAAGMCPFGHGQALEERDEPPAENVPTGHGQSTQPASKYPFGHGQQVKLEADPELEPPMNQFPERPAGTIPDPQRQMLREAPPVFQSQQPAFIQPPEVPKVAGNTAPQMVFTGPVFIGYPMDQALAFMQQYSKGT